MAGASRPSHRGSTRREVWAMRLARVHTRDALNMPRRFVEMRGDQAFARARKRLGGGPAVPPFDGDPRVAVVTVNFSTTRLLKMLLLTLSEQDHLGVIHRVVIVDHDSRDGGLPFLRSLQDRIERIHVVEHRRFLHHGTGLRRGISALDRAIERDLPPTDRANILLFLDTDVILLQPSVLAIVAGSFVGGDAAYVGELRHRGLRYPDAQASLLAVRRDVLARRDVRPVVHHNDPTRWMQESIWEARLPVVDFPANAKGYVLHRHRSGRAAAIDHYPGHSLGRATDPTGPTFTGVPRGEQVWHEHEERLAHWLEPDHEDDLVDLLAARFTAMGDG